VAILLDKKAALINGIASSLLLLAKTLKVSPETFLKYSGSS
jgi:hypothetical protein